MNALAAQVRDQGAYRWLEWERLYAETRRLGAELIGARADEVALLKNTSEGISIVASGLQWKTGDRVLIPSVEFPANVYPWLQLQDRGVVIDRVPEIGGRVPIDELEARITPRTRLLALSFVQFLSGYRANLEEVGRLCRSRNVLFMVDAIQGLGAFPVNVEAAHIDFLAADGHKWLMGPEGCAVFYCRSALRGNIRPPIIGWRSVRNRADFLSQELDLAEDGNRFEAGTPNTVGVAGLNAALRFIRRWTLPLIEQRILRLTDYLAGRLQERELQLLSPRDIESEKSGIVSFRWTGDAESLVRDLWKQKIVVASRQRWVRVSPHFYNTEAEIDHFMEALTT